MTNPPSLSTYITNLSVGRIAVDAAANASSMTYLIGSNFKRMVTNIVPAFVVTYNNNNFLVAKSALCGPATVIYYGGQFVSSAPYITYLGNNNIYGIDVYALPNNSPLTPFPWYAPVAPYSGPVAGQSIYSVGSHLMYPAAIQTSGAITVNTTYNITLGVVDGKISNTSVSINGINYLQHTADMESDNSAFGPLFAIQNDVATLIGMNVQYAYLETLGKNYIGVSFAYGQAIIQAAIQGVISAHQSTLI